MSQLFPGRDVTIDARCVQSGDAIHLRMRDGELRDVSPQTVVGHANTALSEWGQPSWAFT